MPIRKFIISVLCVFIPSRKARAQFRTFFMYCDANRVRRCFIRRASYDCIFSFGNACFCANALDLAQLRKFSAPFDWIAGAGFNDRVNLILAGFPDFFNKEDFVYQGAAAQYMNTRTGFLSVHDFLHGDNFEHDFAKVQEKYNRRISRLLSKLETSKRILILYSDKNIDPRTIKRGAETLQQHFGGHVDFLCIDFATNAHRCKVRRIDDNIMRITVQDFSDWATPQRKRATRQLVTALSAFRAE